MNAVPDFEDLLKLFDRHSVRSLIVGGLAFIYHAKPRFTKDLDLWLDGDNAMSNGRTQPWPSSGARRCSTSGKMSRSCRSAWLPTASTSFAG